MPAETHTHDWRVNPLDTVRSWPVKVHAVCADEGCDATRQLGTRGWTLRPTKVQQWPAVTFDQPATEDARQLTITG